MRNRLIGTCILIVFLVTFSSCSERKKVSQQKAELFFEMFADRSDWEGFIDLYADNLLFEDVVYGLKYNKDQFIDFYNWPDTSFRKHPEFPKSLVLEDLALTDSSAVGKGYFTPFYFGGQPMAIDHKWRFTIWLYFDGQGKIKRHIDFIDYPAEFMKSAAEGRIGGS
ncbi:hypothetical protein [Roseivirga sp. E12]|uniref:hypothetical protein n=1 Tax=Roseivirga sp. E12 TaxID=2819237 RepID=UPI001ABD3E06|nr:hypothetical protein [Roseivirga sp. E12]MBO3696936.1 hypothetical protein [Roseivirga sp. E12]